VGDPSQTIYSFTGATHDHLLGFPRATRRHRGPADPRLPLHPPVVSLANNLLARAGKRPGRLGWNSSPTGSRTAPDLAGYDDDLAEARPSPPGSGSGGRRHPPQRDSDPVSYQRPVRAVRTGSDRR
jgi:superfamily I DNA/RNA helicase